METPAKLTRRQAVHYRRRHLSRITIPSNVGPLARLVFEEMRRQGVTYDEVEDGAGVLRATLKAWRRKNKPGLESIEAVLGFLGWDFVPIPRTKVIPPELVAELVPIAERFALTLPEATVVLVGQVTGIHARFDAPSTAPTLEAIAA